MLRKALIVVSILPVALLLAGSTTALAGPFYIGASVVETDFKTSDSGGSFQGNATSYKTFAGFRFMKFFGVEAGYIDFGSTDDSDAGTKLKFKATAWDAFAVGVLPLGKRMEVWGKAGLFSWDRTTDASGAMNDHSSDTGTDTVYGAGGAFTFGKHLAVRVEYEKYKMSDVDNLSQWSAGAEFRF